MTRIIFVDDEQRVLDGIRRFLYPMREEWHMSFATGGAQALEIMAHDPFDVIVDRASDEAEYSGTIRNDETQFGQSSRKSGYVVPMIQPLESVRLCPRLRGCFVDVPNG